MTAISPTRPRSRSSARASALLTSAAAAALALIGCQRTPDLLQRLAPAASVLELRIARVSGDSAFVVLHLTNTGSQVLGSATVAVALDRRAWAFDACAPVAAEALVACHQGDTDLRIAAAWASGAPSGALVTFTLIRKSGTAAPTLRLTATEMHSAFGHSLADSIAVRREGPP